MKKTLLLSISLFLVSIGHSQTFISNGISYEIITGTSTVNAVDYNTLSGSVVVVPKTVTNPNTSAKLSVIGIGADAFKEKGLTSLTLSEGLLVIKNRAFYNNSITGTLVIPNSITTIEAHAFNFNAITDLNLGSGIEVVLTGVFGNNNLTSLTLPSQISVVDWGSFGSNQIVTLTIDDGVGQLNGRMLWDNPLITIISNSTVPPIITTGGNDDSFHINTNVDDRANIDLVIPNGTMGAYVTNTGAKWTGFKSVTESSTVGISAANLRKSGLSIYPNPANDILTIDFALKIEKLVIVNTLGKTVAIITTQKNTIDVSGLAKGIYFVQVKANDKWVSEKFIKK
jgi:hypothetical protein